jgi:predicted phosphodiesterase
MRYLLLSDIHANRPALEAVLRHATSKGEPDAICHLGDLVGYAPWPNEVIAMLRDADIPGVAGNYDSTVAHGYKHCGCRAETAHQEELAHLSFTWTLAHTSESSKRYLRSMPFRIDIRPFGGHLAGPTIRLVHGNHVLNTVYVTADRPDDFLTAIADGMGARQVSPTNSPTFCARAGGRSVAASRRSCSMRSTLRPPETRSRSASVLQPDAPQRFLRW